MAFVVLFVSVGWDVCFHYCTSSHKMTSHIGMKASTHAHCFDLDPCHEESHEHHPAAVHFDAKGCCDDFDSRIQFSDSFTFSAEKQLNLHFQPCHFHNTGILDLTPVTQQVCNPIAAQKIPLPFVGRIGLIFFSQLKLNPLVF